jgi:hypothetical protein
MVVNEALRILRSQFALTHQIVLIIIGAVLQISLLVGAIWHLSRVNAFINPTPVVDQFVLVAIAYFVLTLAFSIFTSLTTKPKIIISPWIIQILTIVLFIFMVAVLVTVYPQVLASEQQIENLSQTIMMYTTMIFVAGLAQEFIVRELVGVSGSREDIDKMTFTINASFVDVVKAMTNIDFLNRFALTVKVNEDDFVVILGKNQKRTKQIFVLVPDRNDPKNAILTSLCYQILFYNFFKTEDARDEREAILAKLQWILNRGKEEQNVAIKNRNIDHEESLKQAYYYALQPTQTKLSSIRNAPQRFTYTIIVLALIGIGFTITHVLTASADPQPIGIPVLTGVWIAIIVGILTQLVPSIKDRTSKPEKRHSL